MKIFRTLYGEFSEEEADFLSNQGVKIKRNVSNRIYIEEGEKYKYIFNTLSKTIERTSKYSYSKAVLNLNRIYTYSIEEIAASNYCRFRVPIGGGYPQPENIGYLYSTYDGTMCQKCALPMNQVNNFRVSKVSNRPLWGFTSWVSDAIFVHEDFYKQVFEPLGIGRRPVEKRSGVVREGIAQLVLPITEEDLDLSFHDVNICPSCGSKRYMPWGILPYYPEPKNPISPIYLTKEVFGTGWANTRDVIMSTDLALKLLELKAIKLDDLTPCRNDFEDFLKKNPDLIPTRKTLTYDFKKKEWIHGEKSEPNNN